jgi:hypothetical protein
LEWILNPNQAHSATVSTLGLLLAGEVGQGFLKPPQEPYLKSADFPSSACGDSHHIPILMKVNGLSVAPHPSTFRVLQFSADSPRLGPFVFLGNLSFTFP